jgi:hypothetical protein
MHEGNQTNYKEGVWSGKYFGATSDRRKARLARLLPAKATGEPVNFGYDPTGDGAAGRIRVHRVG